MPQQFLFEISDGTPIPRLPYDEHGTARAADGERYLDERQAAAKTGWTEAALKNLWQTTWADVLPSSDQIQSAPAPVAGRAARLGALRRLVYGGLSDEQFDYFIEACEQRGLNPWCRHIVPKPGFDEANRQRVVDLIVTVDGFRTLAWRSGRYAGWVGPKWSAADGPWTSTWTSKDPPAAARFGVRVKDCPKICWRSAMWNEYAQWVPGPNGLELADFWHRFPAHMLGKVSEAHGLRAAFPDLLAGLYCPEEMDQARNPKRPAPTPPQADGIETPATRIQLERALLDLGLSNPRQRSEVVERFRTRHPDMAESAPPEFYAMVFDAVRANPSSYRQMG